MRIDFECEGGYGGLQLEYHGDISDLPPDVAEEIEGAVAESGIWELSQHDLGTAVDGPPDVFSYQFSLRDEDKHTSLSFTDVTAPHSLRPLLAILRKVALKEGSGR